MWHLPIAQLPCFVCRTALFPASTHWSVLLSSASFWCQEWGREVGLVPGLRFAPFVCAQCKLIFQLHTIRTHKHQILIFVSSMQKNVEIKEVYFVEMCYSGKQNVKRTNELVQNHQRKKCFRKKLCNDPVKKVFFCSFNSSDIIFTMKLTNEKNVSIAYLLIRLYFISLTLHIYFF